MAAGWDISGSAASAISQALSTGVNSNIVFGDLANSGIDQQPKAGAATSTAARSLQGDVANAQPDEAFSTLPSLLPSGGGNILIYLLLAAVAVVGVIFIKRK